MSLAHTARSVFKAVNFTTKGERRHGLLTCWVTRGVTGGAGRTAAALPFQLSSPAPPRNDGRGFNFLYCGRRATREQGLRRLMA